MHFSAEKADLGMATLVFFVIVSVFIFAGKVAIFLIDLLEGLRGHPYPGEVV